MADKPKNKAPDEMVFKIPFQGIEIEVKRGDPLYKKLAAEAEKQIENQFLEERVHLLDTVKRFVRDSFSDDDLMALNGFAFYFHFNAQRLTDNGCVKTSALKVYQRVPKPSGENETLDGETKKTSTEEGTEKERE